MSVYAPAVKICGLQRAEDTAFAAREGADFLGFVVSSGFGRSVDATEAAAWAAELSPKRVAVLVDETVAQAARKAAALGADVLQLHGTEPPEFVDELRTHGPWDVWKAVRVRKATDVRDAVERYGSLVDALLFEGFREGVVGGGGARLSLPKAEWGGALVDQSLWGLAGGLDPSNVIDAILRFRPGFVDVSSGVESVPGRKDHEKVRSFISQVREWRTQTSENAG